MLQGPGPWQLGVWAQPLHALGTEPLTADDHLTKASWTRDSQDAPANSILLTYLLPWFLGPDHTPPWWRIPLMSIAEKPCHLTHPPAVPVSAVGSSTDSVLASSHPLLKPNPGSRFCPGHQLPFTCPPSGARPHPADLRQCLTRGSPSSLQPLMLEIPGFHPGPSPQLQ